MTAPLSDYSEDEIIDEAMRILRARRKGPPKQKKLRPCPKCGVQFGAREIRLHLPKCEGKKP